MKKTTILAKGLFLAVAACCLSMTACNQPHSSLGPEHQKAVELTETMRLTHKGMMERLEFLKSENKDFKHRIKGASHPSDSLLHIVAFQDSLIQAFEGMCKEQKRLIDQNEDYIKRHERRSLDGAKVAEQHQKIQENYERLQLQAAAVVQEVENIKNRIDGAQIQ